ncbi:disulfide bond formation protein B [Parahaliea mediterranea]|uniref:disulfide bond formation protein B n=1 Tax=Parahaliea mediterranea TaxID=651086 RepID=UPI0018820493|nr:disulfide bond formation protein B [Parahaliea mediterranea]
MLQSLSPRLVFFGLALLSLVSMLFAYYYLQQHLGLAPCPLCMTQRVAVVAVGVFALLAALHNPPGWGRRLYAGLCLLAAAFGAAVAGRHVWLQHLPEDQVPACGPSLEYMLETLPFSETVSMVLMGDGNCAETMWTFLGLTIPEQTLLLFVVMLLASLWQMLRPRPTA